ncbi:hypothetical protein B0H14DRAFT_3097169 [Mycena olivaceomarginata]|nr:hypothetical protein B0H14DRAFT_3097169 [Mycena olivaceomarginata]
MDVPVCECRLAAVTLVRGGAFPCAPLQPSLAVDLRVLSSPSNCFSTSRQTIPRSHDAGDCLEYHGYQLNHQTKPTVEHTRRRFSNTLTWYGHLRDRSKAITTGAGEDALCPSCAGGGTGRVAGFQSASSRISCTTVNASDAATPHHSPSRSPSPHATFGKRKTSASDPSRRHPCSHFVPEADAKATDAYVNETRGLLASFKAADEKRVKASTDFFEDTGLMALLCRHDRVLWLVNMQTRGEQQYYVIVLLETLFQHLPQDITVGILYDIACTLERSCRKWGFLSRFMHRIQFAVSVFHAFGHDWPCQLLYHPRKRTAFGLSDGEGCERFWHAISHLIAVLRISGKWQRLYVLDAQIEHADELSLQRLGDWLRRRSLHSRKKCQEAESALAECRVRISVLREQWQLQVIAQTKPLPRRSKNKGQQAINAILLLRSAVKKQTDYVNRLRAKFLGAAEDADEEADYYQVEFDKADAARATAEKTLREKERALGVGERRALGKMSHLQYYNARMNARATKRRLRDRLRQRKFELDLVERSFRRLVNVKRREKGIQNLAFEYNKQCAKVAQLIRDKNAPRGMLAPRPIPDGELWKLDVDDEIWEDQTTPPLWLCDDGVRAGIKAVLQIDRSNEEDIRLKKERAALQVWFAEEWALVNSALNEADTAPDRYQYELMRDDLVRLCATWQKSLPDCGLDISALPPLDTRRAARGEDRHYNADQAEFSDEEEEWESGGENEVFSMLDTLATADAYREEDWKARTSRMT